MTGNGQADTVALAGLLSRSEESHPFVFTSQVEVWQATGRCRKALGSCQELGEQKWGLRMGRLAVSADGKVKQCVRLFFS